MAKKDKDWDFIDKIKKLAKNHSYKEVGEKFGRTRNSIASIARREKISFCKEKKDPSKKKSPSPKKTKRVRRQETGPVEMDKTMPLARTNLLQTVQTEKCEWPEEKIGRDYKRCGKPAVMKKPDYCKEHSEKAYKPSSEKARGLFRLSQHYK